MISQVKNACFGLEFSLDTIQAIRLCAALLESEYSIHFLPEAALVLRHWKQYFNVNYHIGISSNVPILKDIEIAHNENPLCRVGSLKTTLLYPHCMIDKCRSLWKEKRTINFSFSGLITAKRKQALESWMDSHFEVRNRQLKNIREHSKSNKISHLYRRLTGSSGGRKILDKTTGIYIYASDQGRRFPIKVWDEEYYQTLSNSKFILCPDGDFVWTYRFFEAIFCGAIPVVENSCHLYEGYHYFLMNTPLDELVYSDELVKKNFQKAKTELTFVPAELNAEIERLLCRVAN